MTRVSLGLALCLLAPNGHHAFTPPHGWIDYPVASHSSRSTQLSALGALDSDERGPDTSADEAYKDRLRAEAELAEAKARVKKQFNERAPDTSSGEAYQDRLRAEAELAEAKARVKEQMKALAEQKSKRILTLEEEKDAVSSGIGGVFLGLFVGALAAIEIPDVDMILEPIVLPVIGAMAFSIAGFAAGSDKGKIGEIIRATLGGPTREAGNSIVAGIQGAIDGALDSAQTQVRKTTYEIKGIPGKVADAAASKVEKTKDELAKVPGKVKEAATKKAMEVANEIKATPGRVVETTKTIVADAVDDALDALEKALDEVKAIPQKAAKSVEEKVNKMVGKPMTSLQSPKMLVKSTPKVPEPTQGLPPKRTHTLTQR